MRRRDREVADRQEIEEIIKSCKVAHVAMAAGNMPYVVPLNFGYRFREDGALELYFHSAMEGRKLDIFRQNNKVCFEMCQEGETMVFDDPCRSGCLFASVIGFGEVSFVEDTAEKCEGLSLLFLQQTGRQVSFEERQAASVCVYKLVSGEFTGKRRVC